MTRALALAELTTRYEKVLAAYGLKEWAPSDFDHATFSRALDMIRRFGKCPGCLRGGGRDNCEIRTCVLEKRPCLSRAWRGKAGFSLRLQVMLTLSGILRALPLGILSKVFHPRSRFCSNGRDTWIAHNF